MNYTIYLLKKQREKRKTIEKNIVIKNLILKSRDVLKRSLSIVAQKIIGYNIGI